MKNNKIKSIILIAVLFVVSCSERNKSGVNNTLGTYSTNGETIFRTGKNIEGVVLQDLVKSEMKSVHGCANCHGDDGKGKYRGGGDKQTHSITYTDLTTIYNPVYNDSLISRFIDSETKSNGVHANTGVVFVMKESDKKDLINFLKTL